MSRAIRPPKYSKHSSGQARVQFAGGKVVYLGAFESPESLRRYREILAKWEAEHVGEIKSVGPLPRTINEIMRQYVDFVVGYYPADGGEPVAIKQVLREARRFEWNGLTVGTMLATEFGPLVFAAIRDHWAQRVDARHANKMAGRLRRMFRWGVSKQLVPGRVLDDLKTVEPLRSRDRKPAVTPVVDAVIDTTLVHLHEPVTRMVQLQRLTGMRPGEICALRWEEIDCSSDIWLGKPKKHKTRHHNKERIFIFGPKAQRLLIPNDDEFVFPASTNRPYRERSYRQAIVRACMIAFKMPKELQPPRRKKKAAETGEAKLARLAATRAWIAAHAWSPNQIRHSVGTEVRRRFGVELSQILLGHATLSATEIYAERDLNRAIEVVRQIG